MKKLFLLGILILHYHCSFSQWGINGDYLYYNQGGIIIGDNVPVKNRDNSKLSIISTFDSYGGGGYGIVVKHATNHSLLKFNSLSIIGYSSIWSTQAQCAAIASTLTISKDNASQYNTNNAGGVFQLTFDNYTPEGSLTACHYLGGTLSLINGSINQYPPKSIISAVIGEDQIKNENTFAGYFIGKGYFSDNIGIGITNPKEKLEIKGNIKFDDPNTGLYLKSPDGKVWKITIDNNGQLKSEPVADTNH